MNSLKKYLNRYAFHVVGAIVFISYLLIGIFKSTNSTASLGFLLIPVFTALGLFVGDSIKYAWDLIQKKRPHSMQKSLLILVFAIFAGYKFGQSTIKDKNLAKASDTATPVTELHQLLKKEDAELTAAVLANASLPISELNNVIQNNLTDYYLIQAAIKNPHLSPEMMRLISSLEASQFKGAVEYNLYQNIVWAKLAKRADVPQDIIHILAAKKNPQHFLILALLESSLTTCEETEKFLPQSNSVLENAITKSLESKRCLSKNN